MERAFGSKTLWARVTADPKDDQAWHDFFRHYWPVVYDWALTISSKLKVRWETAEDVATAVFENLFELIRAGQLSTVNPDDNGSFKPYIFRIVQNLCRDNKRSLRARIPHLPEAFIANMEDPACMQNLTDRLAERESLDIAMARYGERYTEAVQKLKADPQFDPETFRVFLRVYRDGKKPCDVAVEFDYGEGGASKTARRHWKRLLALMWNAEEVAAINVVANPDGTVRPDTETILAELVRVYGEPPE